MAWGPDGSLYVADQHNDAIRKISPQGQVTTVVGAPSSRSSASVAPAGLEWPAGILVDPEGTLWVTDYETGKLLRIDLTARTIRNVPLWGILRDGSSKYLTQRGLSGPNQLCMDAGGVLYVTEYTAGHVTRLR